MFLFEQKEIPNDRNKSTTIVNETENASNADGVGLLLIGLVSVVEMQMDC